MKALITGASSGMGSDFARILSTKCDELILVARNKERLEILKDELVKNSNVLVKTVALDLSIYDNCIKLYSDYPEIDLLINNAVFGDCGDFTETEFLFY